METALLQDFPLPEREAYLGAIASVATVDRKATEDELQYLTALAEAAEVEPEMVRAAAMDDTNETAAQYLLTLKNSELRYSLVADILTFAKADGKLTADEQGRIDEISRFLEITPAQTQALGAFAEKSTQIKDANGSQNNFLENNGLSDILQKAGIPTGSLLKGLIGVAAPIIISRMMRNRQQSGGNGFGGNGGGLLGSILGGNQSGSSNYGGLGSILGNLSGGRGYGGFGSILGKLLQGR